MLTTISHSQTTWLEHLDSEWCCFLAHFSFDVHTSLLCLVVSSMMLVFCLELSLVLSSSSYFSTRVSSLVLLQFLSNTHWHVKGDVHPRGTLIYHQKRPSSWSCPFPVSWAYLDWHGFYQCSQQWEWTITTMLPFLSSGFLSSSTHSKDSLFSYSLFSSALMLAIHGRHSCAHAGNLQWHQRVDTNLTSYTLVNCPLWRKIPSQAMLPPVWPWKKQFTKKSYPVRWQK